MQQDGKSEFEYRRDDARNRVSRGNRFNQDMRSDRPEATSAEGLKRFVGGKPLAVGRGDAWREITVWIVAPTMRSDAVRLPAVSEPFLAWTMSGEVDFQEREIGGQWITHRIRKGDFFLTFGGEPYDVRWEAVAPEPFQAMMAFVGMPLIDRALEEVFGDDAQFARLKDVSGFQDDVLSLYMGRLRDEVVREQSSRLLVQGIAQAIAVHLARSYTTILKESPSGSPSLPGYKIRRVTELMANHIADEFNLDQLAEYAGLSKFYFHRLFKNATGMSPTRYYAMLRLTEAKRLLRETDDSIASIALEVGYANPSHFAQFFRKETMLSPSDYRRQH